jgi:OmcA/MtrC family decaheme c-type cytochrome
MSLVSRTALTFLAGLVAVPMTPVTHTGPSSSPVAREAIPVAYDSTQKEFYLAADQATFVRPGYVIKVNSVTIGADRKPVVDVNITDTAGQPIDRLGVQTPGPAGTSFIAAWWDPASRHYTAYTTRTQTAAPPADPSRIGNTAIQAGTDTGGKYTDLETGHFKYAFGTALPAGFDQTKTTTIGIYGNRVMPADILGGKTYTANIEYDFRPDGVALVDKWDKINQTTSCNNCHDPLSAHGGSRQDVKLCVLCHQPQTVDPDTGNTVDFKVMIHKIHAGERLPSVVAGTPYVIIGNAQSVHDYSGVKYPQGDTRNCAFCHEGTGVAATRPTQSSVWYSNPSLAACGSCHDDVNFTTGVNHAAGPAADGTCATCHQPQGSVEWDAGIKNAHVTPLKSAQLKGYQASIVSVTNVGPGKKITVNFKLQNGDGTPIDPGYFKVAANGTVNILLGGKTDDYGDPALVNGQPFREAVQTATYNATTGVATYTFTNAIPATATGTWTASIETRRAVTLNPAPSKLANPVINEGAPNQPFNIAVTGTLKARRTLVTLAKCNSCHDRLDILFSHGNQRIAIEHCVICHNPNADDRPFRPADQGPAESVSFARMIHRIHTGESLDQSYVVYGFGGNATNFNEVAYPGDRRDCTKCHVSFSTITPPLPITNIPVVTLRDFFSPRGSATSACTGCHDSRDVAAHAFINTAFFPGSPTVPAEACGTCHATGADFDVAKVHAR